MDLWATRLKRLRFRHVSLILELNSSPHALLTAKIIPLYSTSRHALLRYKLSSLYKFKLRPYYHAILFSAYSYFYHYYNHIIFIFSVCREKGLTRRVGRSLMDTHEDFSVRLYYQFFEITYI